MVFLTSSYQEIGGDFQFLNFLPVSESPSSRVWLHLWNVELFWKNVLKQVMNHAKVNDQVPTGLKNFFALNYRAVSKVLKERFEMFLVMMTTIVSVQLGSGVKTLLFAKTTGKVSF